MAVLFYTYGDSSKDIFRQGLSSGAVPAKMDLFSDLVSKENLLIITSVSIVTAETNQFFMTFDDMIHFYHFGKGVGQIAIAGMIFGDCDGSFPGAKAFYDAVMEARGTEQICSAGGNTFTGVLTDSTVEYLSDPITYVQFSANFAMTDNSLKLQSPAISGC